MSSAPRHPTLLKEHENGAMTYGDGGLSALYKGWAETIQQTVYKWGANRHQKSTHSQIEDASSTFGDYGVTIRQLSIDHFLWVNRHLMPTRITDKLEEEVTVIKFGDNVMVEPTPVEGVVRYLDMSSEKLSFKSKRYGLGLYFESDSMMTPEGVKSFTMYAKKIALIMRGHAAFVAMVRVLQPSEADRIYFSQYGVSSQQITTYHMQTEVHEFAIAHKHDMGTYEIAYKYRGLMERNNGAAPDTLVFNGNKQTLLKFRNKYLTETNSSGRSAPGRGMNPEDVSPIENMTFYAMPIFPRQCYNSGQIPTQSMLNTMVEIGNRFVFRRNAFENLGPEYFRSGTHDYLDIFSEQKNGFHRIYEKDLLFNCGRWDKDGKPHPAHDNLINTSKQHRIDDMFVYFDSDSRHYKTCQFIGDMDPKHLKRDSIRNAVRHVMHGSNHEKLRPLMFAVDGIAVPDGATQLIQFAKHVAQRLGGSRNPVFDPKNQTSGLAVDKFSADVLVFMENCMLLHQQKGASNVASTNMTGVWQHAKQKIAKLNDMTSETWTQDGSDAVIFVEAMVDHLLMPLLPSTHNADILKFIGTITKELDSTVLDADKFTHFIALFEAVKGVFDMTEDKFQGMITNLPGLAVTAGMVALTTTELAGLKTKGKTLTDLEVAGRVSRADERARKATAGPHEAELKEFLEGTTPFANLTRTAQPGREYDVRGYDNDDADEPEYVSKYGRVANEESVFVLGNSTMQVNVNYVMDTFTDPLERSVALAYLAVPIHRDVFESMIAAHIPIPLEYLIVRPWQKYEMSSMLIAQSGADFGETLLGYGHTAVGWRVANKTGDLNTTQWIGAIVKDYARRVVVKNVFHERALGGASHDFYTEAEYEQHVLKKFYTAGKNCPSLVGMAIPVGSYVHPEYCCLLGTIPGWVNETPHYSGAEYYKIRYSFGKLISATLSLIASSSSTKQNIMCYQGSQRQNGNVNGDPGDVIENLGHLGDERAGDKDVREYGNRIKIRAAG